MKPQAAPRHPLVTVRKSTPYATQRRFAEFVGVSEIAIRKIESGSLRMSVSLAERIAHATGVDPATIRRAKSAKPKSLLDQAPYTDLSFKMWSTAYAHDLANDPDAVVEYAEGVKELVEEVLFASIHAGRRKFPAVRWAMCQAIAGVANAFKLESGIAAVRRGNAGPANQRQYEDLKAKTFAYRIIGREITPDPDALPADTYDEQLDPIFDEGAVGDARKLKRTLERRVSILAELRTYSRRISEPPPRSNQPKKAGSASKRQRPSA